MTSDNSSSPDSEEVRARLAERFAVAEEKLTQKYSAQPTLSVVEAQDDHYRVLAELSLRAYEPVVPTMYEDGYAEILGDVEGRASETDVLVALLNGHPIGGVTFIEPGDNPYHEMSDKSAVCVRYLAVDPSAQSLGAGRALMQACIDKAMQSGHSTIALHTLERMKPAIALYESLNFTRDQSLDVWWGPVHGVAYRLEL